MPRLGRILLILLACSATGSPDAAAQQWDKQPIIQTVPGLWGIAMNDSGRGIAVGNATPTTPPNFFTGIVRKLTGNPTWQLVPAAAFTPALTAGTTFWSGVSAVRNTGTVFACGANAVIYKSMDYGATWSRTTTGITGSTSLFDVFFKNQNEGMVVGGSGTAFYTTDGGANWIPQTTGVTANLYAVHCAGSSWYISGANNTFLKFTPPSTWTPMNIPSALGTYPLIEGLQFLNDQIGTISGYNSNGAPHALRTTDGGASWSAFPQQPPAGSSNFYNTVFFFDQSTGWIGNAFNPLAFTTDGGVSWNAFTPNGSASGAISRLDFTSQSDGWASGGAVGSLEGFILRYTGPKPLPRISVTNGSIDFDTLKCEVYRDRQCTIQNSGLAPLVIDSITFPSKDFSLVSPTTPFTIPPSGQTTITVRWTPDTAFSGPLPYVKLSIWSNDATSWPLNVVMTGVRNRARVTFSQTTLNFGDVCAGATSEITITVTPDPVLPATFLSIARTSGDDALTLVSPGPGVFRTPTSFVFRFTPASVGSKTGTYALVFGDPACPQTVSLAYGGRSTSNKVTASQTTIDFGDLCAGQTRDIAVDLTNAGNVDATVLSRVLVSGPDLFPNLHPGTFGPIPPNGTRSYLLRFAPGVNDLGSFTTVYRLVIGACADTVELTLKGRGIKTNVSVVPSSGVTLGPITPSQMATRPVTFTNNSNGPITAGGVRMTPSDPAVTLTGLPVFPKVLQPGESISFTVRYAPTRIETITANLCLWWTQPCPDSLCINLFASATDPPSIVTVTAKSIGVQRCAAAILDSVVVRNAGTGPLNLLSFDITGPQSANFQVLRPVPPVLIASGDSTHIVIAYGGAVDGPASATLGIQHNDAARGNRSDIALTARRESAEFVVEGDTASLSSSCIGQPVTRTLTIRGRGSRAVEITSIDVVGGAASWRVTGTALPTTLLPGQTMTVTVVFTPAARGVQNGQIRVTAAECPLTQVVTLLGEGATSNLVWQSASVNFGTVGVGSTAQRMLRLTNTGSMPATVTGFIVTPASPSLTITNPPALPAILQPQQAIDLTLEYAPTTMGSLFATICAIASAPCPDTVCASLTGLASSDGISVDRTELSLALGGCPGASACDSIRIRNNSSTDVHISAIDPAGMPHLSFLNPPALPLTLRSGSEIVAHFCATPYFTGTESGTVTVRSDDPKYPVITIPVTITRDSVALELTPATADAGAFALCEGPQTLTLTAHNTGTTNVALQPSHLPAAPFALVGTLQAGLVPAEDIQILISVTPPGPGSWTDSLVLVDPCGREVVARLHASVPDPALTIDPSPLNFGTVGPGSSLTADLTVRNATTRSARIVRISITDPSGVFSTSLVTPAVVPASGSLPIPVRFAPMAGGSMSGRLCIILDQPCPDSICVDVTGSGADGAIVFQPEPLAFRPLTQCEREERADTLTNGSTLPLTLTATAVTGANTAAFTLLDPVTAPELLSPGAQRIFHVRFEPGTATDGPLTATLDVTTTSIVQPHLLLDLRGTKWSQMMPADQTLAFGAVTTGSAASRTLTLTNAGSAPLTITGVAGAPSLQTVPVISPTQPLVIAPGSSANITVLFTAPVDGAHNLRLVFSGTPCTDSTVVTVTATASAGVALADLAYGIIPACVAKDTVLTLVNGTSADISVTGIVPGGADASRITVLAPTGFPVTVGAGQPLSIAVRLTPDPLLDRTYDASIDVAVMIGGSPRNLRAILSADARLPRLMAAGAFDHGIVPLTLSSARSWTFRNSSGLPVNVTRVTPASASFVITATRPTLPAIIPAGGTLEVDVTYTPAAVGPEASSLVLETADPCASTTNHPISGQGVDDAISATLSISSYSGVPDERIIVALELGTDLGVRPVTSYQGMIRFNTTMLYPRRVFVEGTKSSAMTLDWFYDRTRGAVVIDASGAAIAAGPGALLFIEFQVLIGDAVSTALTIDENFAFTSGRVRVASRVNGDFLLTGYCLGDGNRLVKAGRGFALEGNAPNPFNPLTTVSFELDMDGATDLVVTDLTGREVAVLARGVMTAGRHAVRFHADGLPSGVYLCILRHGGRSLTRVMHVAK